MKALGGKSARKVAHVHVVGAGVMGGDIAAWCASRGLTVTLQDREMKYVEPALARAKEFFGKRARDPAKAAEMAARLKADIEAAGVPGADIVIEAIFENADAKRALYAKLEPRMKPGAILATNTSSIVLEELAQKLADPGRLVGLHFFNPVAKMMLVEIIRSQKTQPGYRGGRARLHAQPRQAAPALPQLAGFRRQPRADALHDRGDAGGG